MAERSTSLKDPVLLAEIGAAHGVRGEVRLKSHTGDPAAFSDYGPLFDGKGRRYVAKTARYLKDDMFVVAFEGVSDRNAAESLTRTKLYVERAVLPETEDEDEFYHADLIGLSVVTMAGETVGSVLAVQNFGADDLIEVTRPGRRSIYIPFTKAVVPVVDIAGRRIVVDPPAGLLDEAPAEEGEDGAPGDGPAAES